MVYGVNAAASMTWCTVIVDIPPRDMFHDNLGEVRMMACNRQQTVVFPKGNLEVLIRRR